jgi:hypothetical protein
MVAAGRLRRHCINARLETPQDRDQSEVRFSAVPSELPYIKMCVVGVEFAGGVLAVFELSQLMCQSEDGLSSPYQQPNSAEQHSSERRHES